MGDRPHSDRPHAESTHTVGGSGSSGPQGEPCDQLVSRQPDHVPRSAQTRRRARSGSLACQKAAARGRGALTPLRMPPGGVRLFRSLCLGASRTGQRRRPATHSEGGRPALAAESLIARRWPAVVTPGRAVQRAGDAAASHSAADGAGPSIEGARTYAHASSRGAALRFCAFRSADQGALSDDGPNRGPTFTFMASPNPAPAKSSLSVGNSYCAGSSFMYVQFWIPALFPLIT
jgi:hypothetical protein